jgi:hypothetical protein
MIVVPELRTYKNDLPFDLALLEHRQHCFAHLFFISVLSRATRRGPERPLGAHLYTTTLGSELSDFVDGHAFRNYQSNADRQ